jgi:hypothetical protein
MNARLATFVRSDRAKVLIPICAGLFLIACTLAFRKPHDTREGNNSNKVRNDITTKTNRETNIKNDPRASPGMSWGPTVTNTPICE